MDIVTKAIKSIADFSECMHYRWTLTRHFEGDDPRVLNFVMLNPSTANADFNDPTVARCENRTLAMGYGTMIITNIFAFRATDPQNMRQYTAPVGDENDEAIVKSAQKADMVICAWGNHGQFMQRGQQVKLLLAENNIANLYYLKMNGCGEPAHPLYLRNELQPVLWNK